jgi:hypothetical protein
MLHLPPASVSQPPARAPSHELFFQLGPAITLSTLRTVVASPPFSRLVRGFERANAM